MIMDINILDGGYYFYLKCKDFHWVLDIKTLSIDVKWGGESRLLFKVYSKVACFSQWCWEFRCRWLFSQYIVSSFFVSLLLNWLWIWIGSLRIISKANICLPWFKSFNSLTMLCCRYYCYYYFIDKETEAWKDQVYNLHSSIFPVL